MSGQVKMKKKKKKKEDRPLFWHDNNKSLQACGVYQLQKKIKNE